MRAASCGCVACGGQEELIRTLAHTAVEAEAAVSKYGQRVNTLQAEVDGLKHALVEQVGGRRGTVP